MIPKKLPFSKEKEATVLKLEVRIFPFDKDADIKGLYFSNSERESIIRIDSNMEVIEQVKVLGHELFHFVADMFLRSTFLQSKEPAEEGAADRVGEAVTHEVAELMGFKAMNPPTKRKRKK